MIKAQCAGFLNTPPLWENEQFDIQQFAFPKIKLDTFQPEPSPSNLRLGHQMEYVFKQLVAHSDTYDIALYNLPIRNDKRTLGEIDFILRHRQTLQLIHVELTYKFYIINPEISDPIQSLVGPNNRDQFYLKMEKIKNVQFPLLHSTAGIKALESLDIDHFKLEHQCCFKGQIFKPYGTDKINIGNLNKECLAGNWLQLNEFNSSDFKDIQYYMPSKSEWVIAPHDNVLWKSHEEILVNIEESFIQEKAPMLWAKRDKGDFEKLLVLWW